MKTKTISSNKFGDVGKVKGGIKVKTSINQSKKVTNKKVDNSTYTDASQTTNNTTNITKNSTRVINKGNRNKKFSRVEDTIDIDNYASPVFTKKIVKKITGKSQTNVLVLTGRFGFRYSEYLKYLAKLVAKKRYKNTVKIKEWVGSPDRKQEGSVDGYEIIPVLKAEKKEGIYLINDLTPYDDRLLNQLDELAKEKNMIILASTADIHKWNLLPAGLEKYIYQIPTEDPLYSHDQILNTLLKTLTELDMFDRFLVPLESFLPESSLAPGLTINELARQFANNTLTDVQGFIHILNQINGKITADQITSSLNKAKQNAFKEWFYGLTAHQKLIALGLTFFDGLLDVQFFSIVEHLVQEIWNVTGEKLRFLDLYDMEALQSYHRWEMDTRAKRDALKIDLPAPRYQVLKEVFWTSHRRHILSTISELERILLSEKSIYWSDANLEEEDEYRNSKFERMVGQLISDVGMISEDSIQGLIHKFACHTDRRLNKIAAIALSEWFRWDEQEKFYNFVDTQLNSFQPEIDLQIAEINKVRNANKREKNELDLLKQVSIRMDITIAYTLGHISYNYPPNKLPQRFMDRLTKIFEGNFQYFDENLKFLLPEIIQRHPMQFLENGYLESMIERNYLRDLVVQGMHQSLPYFQPNKIPYPFLDLVFNIGIKYGREALFPLNNLVADLIATNFVQLQNIEFLDKLLQFRGRYRAIGRGISQVVPKMPEKVIDQVRIWYKRSLNMEGRGAVNLKNIVLITIGEIPFKDISHSHSLDFFNMTFDIQQKHYKIVEIRASLLELIEKQIYSNFEHVAPYLGKLIANLTQEDRQFMISAVVTRYIQNRAFLGSGDRIVRGGLSQKRIIFYEGKEQVPVKDTILFNLWVYRDRPRTETERVLDKWLLEPWGEIDKIEISFDEADAIKEFSFQTTKAIQKYFDSEEKKLIHSIIKKENRVIPRPPEEKIREVPIYITKPQKASLSTKIFINYWLQVKNDNHREVMEVIVPSLVNDRNFYKIDFEGLSEKFKLISKDSPDFRGFLMRTSQTIPQLKEKYAEFNRWKYGLIIGASAVVAAGLGLIVLSYL